MLEKIISRKERMKPPFKLKAYNYNEDRWEEIEEFEKPVKISEIKDIIDELLEEGYTRFRLDDSKGEKVWVRYYKSHEKKKENEIDTIDRFAQLMDRMTTVIEKLSSLNKEKNTLDPNEILASNIAFLTTIKNFCENFPQLCGVKSTEDDIVINLLMQMITGRQLTQLQPQPIPQQTIQQTTQPKINPDLLMPPNEESIKIVNKAVEKAMEETAKIWETECKVIGTCQE